MHVNVDLSNHCNIFWVDGGIHTKNRGNIMHEASFAHDAQVFPPFLVWIPSSTQKILQ